MESKRSVCDLLKASMHIVMHNFFHFVPSVLLLCYVMAAALIEPSTSSLIILCTLIYGPVYNKHPAYQSNLNPNPNSSPDPNPIPNSSPDPNPNPNGSTFSSIPFHFNVCIESIKLLLCLCIYLIDGFPNFRQSTALTLGVVCGGFVVFLLLAMMAGFVYTRFTLHSLATFMCPIGEESGARVQAMERWSFSLLRSWAWVAVVTILVVLLLGNMSLESRIFTPISKGSVVGTCFGLPALLFLYIRSTQVTLYLACKTYHTECKQTLITHTSQHMNNDLDNQA